MAPNPLDLVTGSGLVGVLIFELGMHVAVAVLAGRVCVGWSR